MSIHQPNYNQFNQFRTVYLAPTAAFPNKAAYGHRYGPRGVYAQQSTSQGPYQNFYSDYTYYLSPYQHPYAMQQVNAAANNWFLDAMGKVSWNQVVPSWTEIARMSVRSAQDSLKARLPRWGQEQPREGTGTFRAATTEAAYFLGRLV